MPLHPLGICRSRDLDQAPDTVAAGSAVARWSLEGELACAWLEAASGPTKPLEHAAAVAAIHQRICVLPMRFGTVAAEESEVRSLLRARQGELLERLDYLDGAGEMALRVAVPRPSEGPAAPSSADPAPQAYFQRRRAHYQQRDAADELCRATEQRFLERLCGVYRDWRRLPNPAPNLLRLTFLVAREQTDVFRHRLADFGRGRGEDGCLILGPWPPYSFV